MIENYVVAKIVEADIVLGVVTNCLPCKSEVVALGGKIESSSINYIQFFLVGFVTRFIRKC